MGPNDFPFADLIFRTPGVLMTGTGFEAVIVLLYSCAPVTRIMGILRPIRDRETRNTWRYDVPVYITDFENEWTFIPMRKIFILICMLNVCWSLGRQGQDFNYIDN